MSYAEKMEVPLKIRGKLGIEQYNEEMLVKIATTIQEKYGKKNPVKNTRGLKEKLDNLIRGSPLNQLKYSFYEHVPKGPDLDKKKALVRQVVENAKKAYKIRAFIPVPPESLVGEVLRKNKDEEFNQERLKNQEQARKTKNPAQQTQTKPLFSWRQNHKKAEISSFVKVPKH